MIVLTNFPARATNYTNTEITPNRRREYRFQTILISFRYQNMRSYFLGTHGGHAALCDGAVTTARPVMA